MEREPDSSEETPRAAFEVGSGYSARRIRRRADARVRTDTAGDVEWSEEATDRDPGPAKGKRWRLRAWLERPYESEAGD